MKNPPALSHTIHTIHVWYIYLHLVDLYAKSIHGSYGYWISNMQLIRFFGSFMSFLFKLFVGLRWITGVMINYQPTPCIIYFHGKSLNKSVLAAPLHCLISPQKWVSPRDPPNEMLRCSPPAIRRFDLPLVHLDRGESWESLCYKVGRGGADFLLPSSRVGYFTPGKPMYFKPFTV